MSTLNNTKNNNKPSTTTLIAAAGVGLLVAGGIGYALYNYFSTKSTAAVTVAPSTVTKKKITKPKKATSTTASTTATKLTNDELKELIEGIINDLGGMGNSEPTITPERELRYRASLKECAKSVDEYDAESRMGAASMLMQLNMYRIQTARSATEFETLMVRQFEDAQDAWKYVDMHDLTEEIQQPNSFLKIQVAQLLKDADKITEVFELMTKKGVNNMAGEELVVCFTAAPMIGRWKQMRAIGDKLKTQGDLAEFHAASMDYNMLYQLAEKEMLKGDRDPSTLKWLNYRILSQNIKLNTIECDDADTVHSLNSEFTKDGEKIVKNINIEEGVDKLSRVGAIVQVSSFSAIPFPLSGPGDDENIYVKGYVDMKAEGGNIRQTEIYDLKRDHSTVIMNPNQQIWKGTYTMRQEKAPDSPAFFAFPTINVTFDLEMMTELLPN